MIFFSRYEASQFGSPYIETEHILLGLLREDPALDSGGLIEASPVRIYSNSNEAGAKPLRENSNEPPWSAIGGPSESPRKSTGLAMRASEPEGSCTVTFPDSPASSHNRKRVTLPFDFRFSAVTTTPGRDTLTPD